MLGLTPPNINTYPAKHHKNDNIKTTENKNLFNETQKHNVYISVHIKPKSSNRLSDAKEPAQKSNEKVKDDKTGKENDAQKYFVKCYKSDQPSKKYCKECKNYRTKLKVTKLEEQIAENKKLNEKGEEIASYVSKFVAMFGLNDGKVLRQQLCTKKSPVNQNKYYSSSHENITKKYEVGKKSASVSILPKQIMPMKSKPKSDATFGSNNHVPSIVFTEKDIINYNNGVNKTIGSYSTHSLEKYKTTPTPVQPQPPSKRLKGSEDVVLARLSLSNTKCKKNFGIMSKEVKEEVENRKILDTDLIKKSINKRKRGNNDLSMNKSIKSTNKCNSPCKKIDKKDKKLVKVDNVMKKREHSCVDQKQKHTLNSDRVNNVKRNLSKDNQIIRELKSEVKANRKQLIHMERILINKLRNHKPDKEESRSQSKLKGIESRNDVKVIKKSVSVPDHRLSLIEKPKRKNVQITKKNLFMGKNRGIQRDTFKLGRIQESLQLKNSEQKLSKEILSSSNMCKRSIFEKTPLQKYIQYPTIFWPHTTNIRNYDIDIKRQYFTNTRDLQCKSSMEKINELIIPTSNLLKYFMNSDNQNISNKTFKRMFNVTSVPNDLSVNNTIGATNSDIIREQSSHETYKSNQRLRRSQSIPVCLGNLNQLISIRSNKKSMNTRYLIKSYYDIQNKLSSNWINEGKNNRDFKQTSIKESKNVEIVQGENNRNLEKPRRTIAKQSTTPENNVYESESCILPRNHPRKMMRSRSEIHSIAEFYRRYRRTASLSPQNAYNKNIPTRNSTTNLTLKSNTNKSGNGKKKGKANIPACSDYDNFKNPNESNKTNPTNTSTKSTTKNSKNQDNNKWSRHTMPSTSSTKSSFNIFTSSNDDSQSSQDVEKQYMDSIKRHLEYLKKEQEQTNVKRNSTSSSLDESITKKNKQFMFSHNEAKTGFAQVNDATNKDKIHFSKIGDEYNNALKLKPNRSIHRMDNDRKSNYGKTPIDSSLKIKEILNKESNWRVTKDLKNVDDRNKLEVTKNRTILSDPLPADTTKLTVSFETNSSQEVEISNTMIRSSPEKNLKFEEHTENLRSNQLSSKKTNNFTQNLQSMLQRNFLNSKSIVKDSNIDQINKLSKKLIHTLSDLTTKSSEIKQHDLEQIIQNYNQEVTIEFFKLMSKSTHKLNPLSDRDSIEFTSKDNISILSNTDVTLSEKNDVDPSENPTTNNNNQKKSKKHVSIRVSKDSQPLVTVQANTANNTSNLETRNVNDLKESMSEIELEVLKRKHLETLEKIRQEQLVNSSASSLLSVAAVDSIIVTKMRRMNAEDESIQGSFEHRSNEKTPMIYDSLTQKKRLFQDQGYKEDSSEHKSTKKMSNDSSDDQEFPIMDSPSMADIFQFDPDNPEKKVSSHPKSSLFNRIQDFHQDDVSSPNKNNNSKIFHENMPNAEMKSSLKATNVYKPSMFSINTSINEDINEIPVKINTIVDPLVNVRKNDSKKKYDKSSVYLKLPEDDLHEEFSKIIYPEIETETENTSFDTKAASNVPPLTKTNSNKMLRKIDLVDNRPLLTEAEKFNILLNSVTVLKNVIDTPFDDDSTDESPSDDGQRFVYFRNSTVNEPNTIQIFENKRVNPDSEVSIASGKQEEINLFDQIHTQQMYENILPVEDANVDLKSVDKEDCKCVQQCQILTESVLKNADCTCIKQGKSKRNILETCTCIQNTNKLQSIRVVCGHISDEDRCRCKSGVRSLEKIDESQEFSAESTTNVLFKTDSSSKIDLDPEKIGTCFRRGFRADNIALNDIDCLLKKGDDKLLYIHSSNLDIQSNQMGINFSEQQTPLDFLIALGFSVDEGSIALRNEVVKNRLSAAITEARIWSNFLTITQGTLLYLLAYKARDSTMRYFLQIVEAIISSRIPNALQLEGFIKLLDKLESGHLPMLLIFGSQKVNFNKGEIRDVQNQLQILFADMFAVAKKQASKVHRSFTANDTKLLEHLTTYYRPGFYHNLEIIAGYVGRGELVSLVQIEAAIIYLSRVKSSSKIDFNEFEEYCGMKTDRNENDT